MKKSCWIDVENDCDFSIENIPFGICSFPSLGSPRPRCCSIIGNVVIDISLLAEAGLLEDIPHLSSPTHVFSQPVLNTFMEHPKSVWEQVRQRIQNLLLNPSNDEETTKQEQQVQCDDRLFTNTALRAAALIPVSHAVMHLPASIGDYTDFYSSKEHATNVGTMFRGADNALQPNWLHLPVGYHGRSSSVYVSGTEIVRPCGQLQKNPSDAKEGSIFGPCRLLDFELEMGFFVGGSTNEGGERISMQEARNRIFGFVLMNDWSARDIQKWEYVPLGPFGSKNFATTISPWIVTTMALEDYSCPTSVVKQNPTPLPYLQDPNYDSYDIELKVSIQGETMAQAETISISNYANMYWNARQQLVHHSVTGCPLKAGDLLGSGTISGQNPSTFGSLLELSWKGTREVPLGGSGEVRKFLKDRDTVIIEGVSHKVEDNGQGRVGFGLCSGKVNPPVLFSEKESLQNQNDLLKSKEKKSPYSNFKLYGYWRSSSTWRVRVALAAKSISFQSIDVDLFNGETETNQFTEVNSMKQIPVLEFTDETVERTVRISQSLAIIDFLEETFTEKGASLIPKDILDRAFCREIGEIINSGIQPHQNLSTIKKYAKINGGETNKVEEVGKKLAQEYIMNGLDAVEKLVEKRRTGKRSTGPFGIGTFSPTLADACIVPQLYNARRFGINIDERYPVLLEVEKSCLDHSWFISSHPDTVVTKIKT